VLTSKGNGSNKTLHSETGAAHSWNTADIVEDEVGERKRTPDSYLRLLINYARRPEDTPTSQELPYKPTKYEEEPLSKIYYNSDVDENYTNSPSRGIRVTVREVGSEDSNDIDPYFYERSKDRNERYKELGLQSEEIWKVDNANVKESIRMTVARMTRNYHQSTSSDDYLAYDEHDKCENANSNEGHCIYGDETDLWNSVIDRSRLMLTDIDADMGYCFPRDQALLWDSVIHDQGFLLENGNVEDDDCFRETWDSVIEGNRILQEVSCSISLRHTQNIRLLE
jgi:hypothetical protein